MDIDLTMVEVAFDRMEIIRCALRAWSFPDKINQVIFEECANKDANGIWRRFFSWCSGLSKNPLTQDLCVLSEILESRAGKSGKKGVRQSKGVGSGISWMAYLNSVDPSKVVLRTFQRARRAKIRDENEKCILVS